VALTGPVCPFNRFSPSTRRTISNSSPSFNSSGRGDGNGTSNRVICLLPDWNYGTTASGWHVEAVTSNPYGDSLGLTKFGEPALAMAWQVSHRIPDSELTFEVLI
jgi:hypothetical protein